MKRVVDFAWWYWLFALNALTAGLFGWPWGLLLAIVLTVVQIGHVLRVTGDPTSLALQIRAVYLVLLIAGLWGPLKWIHWTQLIGTAARVMGGYCFLARTLSLAPWNRRLPLSWALVRRAYASPTAGGPPCTAAFSRMSLERVGA